MISKRFTRRDNRPKDFIRRSAMNKLERRVVTTRLTLRAAGAGDSGPGTLAGYAAKFNTLSQDLGGFKEQLCDGSCGRSGCRGAFTRALEEKQDIRALFNHDPNMVLGRLKTGTLKLRTDNTGLYFECQLPDTSIGRDVHTMVADGLVDQCSFAFKVADGGDEFSGGKTQSVRTVHDLNLFDVSAVTYPAYLDTSVSAHYDIATPPAPPVVLMTELERAQLRGERIAADDRVAYQHDVDESNRPRTIDPLQAAIRKNEARNAQR
jgi:uncharacterized protein